LKLKTILLMCAFALLCSAANAGEILIIHSYHQGFAWTDRIQEGIDSVLDANEHHIEHIEYLDTKRNNYDEIRTLLHEVVDIKHKNKKFDLIIVSDNNALEFALNHREEAYVDISTPIIFCGINPLFNIVEVKDVTGVMEEFDLTKTIYVINQLQPDVTHIGVVIDTRLPDNSVIKDIFDNNSDLDGYVSWIHTWTIDGIKKWILSLPVRSAIIKYLFSHSIDGKILSLRQVTSMVKKLRPDISMYTVCDFEVGVSNEIIGGYVINGFKQGEIAANMAVKVLSGIDINSIPVVIKSPNTPMFDYNVLMNRNIDLQRLPVDSVIINAPISFYDKYKKYFWPSITIIVIQFFIIVAFITQRLARLKVEKLLKFTKFAVHAMKDAAFWLNKNGRFVYVNQTACSQLGYTKDQLMKKNVWDIHFSDFGKKEWKEHFIQMRTKGWLIFEHTHKREDSSKIPVEISATYVVFDKVEYIVAFARDITNRLAQRKIIEDSERKYRTIYETSMVGMFQIQISTGKTIEANPAHIKMLGYDDSTDLFDKFTGWGKYTDQTQINNVIDHLREVKRIDNLPIKGTKKDGSDVALEVSARYNEEHDVIDGILINVTDRKLAEKALIESEKKYRVLVETSPYGIEELDINGKLIYVNSAYIKMMRMSKDEVLGHYIWEFVGDKNKDELKDMFRSLPIDQPDPKTYQGKNITKGGRTFDVQVDWNYKRDKNNEVIGFVGIVSDISDVVRYRERQELSSNVLDILNSEFEAELTIKKILTLIKRFTRLDAVAIRLQDNDEYPYYVTEGFDEDFVQKETHICSRDEVGNVIRHSDGTACLDCMCGMIICGETDSNLPHFTIGGSFWTNNTVELLKDDGVPTGVKLKTRNRCNAEGYMSVGLIPLVSPEGINIGLLQLNDRRRNMFTLDMIEFFEGLGASIGIALGRKQSQYLIRESEERYRTLFETAPLAIIFWDEHTHIKEWNDHAEKIFGWSKEEVIGNNIFDFLIPKHERLQLLDVVESLLNKTLPIHIVNDNLTKSGDVITCEWNNTILHNDKGELVGVISLGQDITSRVKAEYELQTASQIFETVPSGIFIYECKNLEMILIDGNPAAELITRIDIGSNQGKSFDEIWPGGGDLKNALYNSCVLKNGPYENEGYIYHSDHLDGVYRIKAFCLPGDRIAIAFEDITYSYNATKSLEESEEKFRLAFTTSPDPIILLKANSGIIVDVNQGFTKESGYTREEAIGKDVIELEMWSDQEDRDKFYESLGERGYVDSMEAMLRGKDGVSKSALVSSSVIKIGGEDHILSIIKDISGMKKAQEALLEKERQLRRASKMEAVGTLAGGVAHDFNNIVQIISGNLQLLMVKDHEDIKSQLSAMYTASMRGADLAKRLLTFSRQVESRLQSINVNEEIKLAHKLLDRAATGPVMIKIKLKLQEDLPLGLADPTQLNQVITNLCINAKDAMPHGGHIMITTKVVELDEYYCEKHPDATPGNYIRICIVDSGEGMSFDVQERIFEPFFTTKEPGKGTGLGLAVVYGIMQSHGGYITVYSNLNEGTEFKLYIPISDGEEMKQTSIDLTKDLIGGKETILMIDDEEDIKKVGTKILEMYGYTVLSACDGISGLETYNNNKELIDLVILDLIMPDIGGTEVLERIIIEEPTAKIIVASGYSANGPINDAIGSGAKSFINKPYTLRELIQQVRKVLDEEE